jgi:hypothetical protein
MIRVLVGTLFSGESELDLCKQSVISQKGIITEHLIISNLSENKAHEQLFDFWNSNRKKFDMFVKVDADTVLMNDSSLNDIYIEINKHKVDGIQLSLLDYYSQQSIYGLGAFSNMVEFHKPKNKLFPDRVVDRSIFTIKNGVGLEHLEPIGYHCLNPHPRQAFRYGLHRQLKKQDNIINSMAKVWLEEKDLARKWALLGVFHAKDSWFSSVDYSDKKFEKNFKKYLNISNSDEWIEERVIDLGMV